MYGNYSHFMKFPTGFGGESCARAAPGGPVWTGRRGIGKRGQPDASELGGGHVCLYAFVVCFRASVSVRAGAGRGEGMVGGEALCVAA